MEARTNNFKQKITHGKFFDINNKHADTPRILSYPPLEVKIKNKVKSDPIKKFIVTGQPEKMSFKVFLIFKNKVAHQNFLNLCSNKVRGQLHVNNYYTHSVHLLCNYKTTKDAQTVQNTRLNDFFAEVARIEHHDLRDNEELMQAIGFKPAPQQDMTPKEIKSDGISLESF